MADQTPPSNPTDTASQDAAETTGDEVEIDIAQADGESQNLTLNILKPEDENSETAKDGEEGEKNASLSKEQVQTLLDLAQSDPELAASLQQLGEENPKALEELVNYLEEIETSAGGAGKAGQNASELGELFRSRLREILDAQRLNAQGGISGDPTLATDRAQGGLDNDTAFVSDGDSSTSSNAGDGNRGDGGGAGNDTFVLQSGAVDEITDFNSSGDAITDYLTIEDDGNGNSVVKVDTDGGGDNFQNVAVLEGVTGLDVQQLFNSGNVVVDES